MIEMLQYPAVFVLIGLIVSAHLFAINYIRRDGLGRIVLLFFVGGIMGYYLYRFGVQIAYYCLDIVDGKQASDLSKHAQWFILAPLVLVEIIEIIYKRKD
jgi:hypothetical protein